MNYAFFALLITVSLFFGMLILLETGRRIGNYRLAQDTDGARAGISVIDGAVFALLGLLTALVAVAWFVAGLFFIGKDANSFQGLIASDDSITIVLVVGNHLFAGEH